MNYEEKLEQLHGYRLGFEYEHDFTSVAETCWCCGLQVSKVRVVLRKEAWGKRSLAPLCMDCLTEFKRRYVAELVAEELMGDEHVG